MFINEAKTLFCNKSLLSTVEILSKILIIYSKHVISYTDEIIFNIFGIPFISLILSHKFGLISKILFMHCKE